MRAEVLGDIAERKSEPEQNMGIGGGVFAVRMHGGAVKQRD